VFILGLVSDITKIIPDDPLFSGKATEGIGNRPEMTILLQDDEILAKFQVCLPYV